MVAIKPHVADFLHLVLLFFLALTDKNTAILEATGVLFRAQDHLKRDEFELSHIQPCSSLASFCSLTGIKCTFNFFRKNGELGVILCFFNEPTYF